MGAPRFLYFDLGNVLVFFDPQIAFDNLAQLAKTQSDQVQQFFASDDRPDFNASIHRSVLRPVWSSGR